MAHRAYEQGGTEVRERLGLDRLEALSLLSALVSEGRLVRQGERRGTRYKRLERA